MLPHAFCSGKSDFVLTYGKKYDVGCLLVSCDVTLSVAQHHNIVFKV